MTTLEAYYPFASGAGSNVTEAQWRRYMGNCRMGVTGVVRGVASSFAVIQRAAGANMSVDVGGGEARIVGHLGYQSGGASAINLGISANASGNPRIDRIVVGADLVNKLVAVYVVTGTPAVSPVPTALVTTTSLWEISLAQIAVASGATSVVTGNITDERTWANAYRWHYDWAISGTQATASGGTNFIIPDHMVLEDGWSAVIDALVGEVRAATSATVKVQSSSTISGALGDVTGLTSVALTTTPAQTLLGVSAQVAILDKVRLAVVVNSVAGTPDSLLGQVKGWKWPTPLYAT